MTFRYLCLIWIKRELARAPLGSERNGKFDRAASGPDV
jgi:hypothetical protein